MIREAAMAADRAWEEFHAAAIGGTLASPDLQATIEVHLHEMRKLLMEARQAERNQQHESARQMTREILHITNTIIQASRERKS
jgi:precorrin-6B methylase 2